MGRDHSRVGRVFAMAFICMSVATAVWAQPCAHYPGQFHWVCEEPMAGYVNLVASTGTVLLAASQVSGVRIFDISAPADPQPIASLPDLTDCIWLTASGDLACAARLGSADLRNPPHIELIDISNPAEPSILSNLPTPGIGSEYLPYCVAIDSSYAYAVFSHMHGLFVAFDIASPEAPEAIAYRNITGAAYGVAVDGARAYVAAGATGLQVFDVTDPFAPMALGTADTDGSAWYVQAIGNTAVVGDRSQKLYTFDVTDPLHPRRLASIDTPGYLWGLKYIGSHAIVADGEAGLYVANVSDPHYIIPSGSLYVGGTANSVTRVGEYIYVAAGDAGVQLARFSLLPEVRPEAVTACPANAQSVAVCRDVACIAGGANGLRTYDVLDPSAATPAGTLAMPFASAVAGRGWHAYVTDAANASLSVVNVSAPSMPWIETHIDIPGQPKDVALSGDYAFVAAGDEGLQIVDISDFLALSLIAQIDTIHVSEVAIDNGYAYLAGLGTFRVADVSDPGVPRMLGQAELPGPATGIKASNGYVYVGVGGSGLQVIDASDPSNPRLAECFTTRSTSLVKDVDVAGDYVYFVDHMSSGLNGSGLNILDVTDPSRPLLAGRATMPSGGAAVVVYGSYAFIAGATDDSGFRIFPAQCGGTTPVLTAEVEARATSGAIELRWDSPSSDFVEFGVDRAASREPAESDYRRIATVPAEEHPRGAVYRFVDADVSPHHWYCYRIIGRSSAGDERVLGEASSSATAVLEPTLFAPWPSYSQGPFRLRFALPLGADVQVDVCDASGRRVRALCRDVMIPGGHELIWDGRDGSGRPVPSGTYSLRLADGPREVTQRVIVIR